MQKVVRKLKEEPLIPLGTVLTVAAFVNAYRAIRRGDSKQANRMFRARVGAQAFTVIAMVAGSMYYSKDREKSAELRKLQEARDAEEKRQNTDFWQLQKDIYNTFGVEKPVPPKIEVSVIFILVKVRC